MFLSVRGDHLFLEDADLVELAKTYGTPLYVYSKAWIENNAREIVDVFSRYFENLLVCYALKANSNPSILRILRKLGLGAEIVSGGELYLSLLAGFDPKTIVFNGNAKRDDEILYAIESGILMINADSIGEIERIERLARDLGVVQRIGLRVNPDISPRTHPKIATGLRKSKFGIDVRTNQVIEAMKVASGFEHVDVVGIHTHIGSQILDIEPFREAASRIRELCIKLEDELGFRPEYINMGGGFGISYDGKRKLDLEKVAEAYYEELSPLGKFTLILEPGRYIVGPAGILLTRVITIKENPAIGKIVAVDAGFNVLIRPVMYGAIHRVLLANKASRRAEENVMLVGPLCESGDILRESVELPRVEEGDIVAILDAGAYGFSMSSNYNSHPKPAEILVSEDKHYLIRRRETYSDLVKDIEIPPIV